MIIKIAGAKAVLARSFARIFYRNCINIGLPAITCNTDEIGEGDELELDMEKGVVRNKTKGMELEFPHLPPVMNRILQEGGLVAYVNYPSLSEGASCFIVSPLRLLRQA